MENFGSIKPTWLSHTLEKGMEQPEPNAAADSQQCNSPVTLHSGVDGDPSNFRCSSNNCSKEVFKVKIHEDVVMEMLCHACRTSNGVDMEKCKRGQLLGDRGTGTAHGSALEQRGAECAQSRGGSTTSAALEPERANPPEHQVP